MLSSYYLMSSRRCFSMFCWCSEASLALFPCAAVSTRIFACLFACCLKFASLKRCTCAHPSLHLLRFCHVPLLGNFCIIAEEQAPL